MKQKDEIHNLTWATEDNPSKLKTATPRTP